ncbi:hypothetical protein GIY23_19980 [Allosaccharopolyspora coralli]|uniref:WXG100 family type VII secretion target n=1 Tax=Allosaccharopolyspora coralli TaxID=2665642 RepID=A0A5Q3QIX5_9PSEU|nr:hypothetical protein [Allosaccharopolyspora coralli]QGK71485.1 hypothetical protein GIY23_19980 [Allosaccharopolyspora coralli]
MAVGDKIGDAGDAADDWLSDRSRENAEVLEAGGAEVGGPAEAFGDLAAGHHEVVGDVAGGVVSGGGDVLGGVVNGHESALRGAADGIDEVVGGGVDAANSVGEGVADGAGELATGGRRAAETMNREFAEGDYVEGVAGGAAEALKGHARAAGDVASGVAEGAGDVLGGVASGAGEVVGGVAEGVGHVAKGAFEGVTDLAGGVIDGIGSGLKAVGNALKDEHTETTEESRKALEDTGPVGKSDELLDHGAVGLKFFEVFLPRLQDWTGSAPDHQGEICRRYDELRGIDFAAFREDAERLGRVQQALVEQNDSMDRGYRTAAQTWQGDAATAAGAKVGTTVEGGGTIAADLERFGGAIPPAVDGIQQTVREYATFVVDLGEQLVVGDKEPDRVDDEIRKAKGDLNLSDLDDVGLDDIFGGIGSHIMENPVKAAAGAIVSGVLPGLAAITNGPEVAGQIRQQIIDDAKQWCDTVFVPEMQTKLDEFDQQTTASQDTVKQAYDQMLQAGQTSDPFAPPPSSKDTTEPSGDEPGTTQQVGNEPSSHQQTGQQTGNQPTATQPSGSGSGGTPSGGGAGTGGMPPGGGAAPEMPKPPDVGMPEMPEPSGHEDSAPEEVTLGEGDDAVTVQEPAPDGRTQVTIVGEDGQPKTYDIAFPPQGGEGAPGGLPPQPQPGAGGMPGQPVPGAPGMPGAQMPGAGAEGETIPLQPDADGQAVIEDGDRTITIERTPEGEVRVDIDNGDGTPPVNQTIGFGSEEPGAMPGEPGGGIPEQNTSVGNGIPAPAPTPEGAVFGQPGGAMSAEGDVAAAAPAAQASFEPASATDADPALGGTPAAPVEPSTTADTAGAAGGPAATTAQSAGFTSSSGGFTPVPDDGGRSFGSHSGQLFGGSDGGVQHGGNGLWGSNPGSTGLPSLGDDTPSQGSSQGSTGLASMGGDGGAAGGGSSSGAGGQGQSGGAGGGMMGMGAMGGAAQQGGDQERSNSSPWRTEGQLFDDGTEQSRVRFQSVLGEDKQR